MNFDPKNQFLFYQKPHADELASQHQQPWFITSLNYSISELAFSGASGEEMSGARKLVQILVNLHEKSATSQKIPVKRLETYEGEGLGESYPEEKGKK